MGNENLNISKEEKDGEFYTQISDIEQELKHYKKHFKDKVIYLNCDDHEWSNFYWYFANNFELLGLKKLIATHYGKNRPSHIMTIERDMNGDGKINNLDMVKTKLKGDGDFRSPECVELLKEADIVVTNPPFYLFREFIAQLLEYDKKFLVIGSNGGITYKQIFPHIQQGKMWLGNTSPKNFRRPDDSIKSVFTYWYTNLDHPKRYEKFVAYKEYKGNELDYPIYDNFDAIHVGKVKDIPLDFKGIMGVPTTFLAKLNPQQFEIVGNEYTFKLSKGRGYIDGKRKYARMFIKWRNK